ncbi:Nitroreductase [Desulfotomaculum arcticum]|uniref:Nitroreductase n=1 Tax=Desulfotruncus arcticus DSM 17038 TaxID=1121424 RepID=A0A1I2YMS1_9FIRM|nr:nitroreductase [Desulfotruncus arcticus]SFH26800.1 Nitroreductase [Desulfotomaculum arcticum] [Desulfotruncus arcticus DSM 17038]
MKQEVLKAINGRHSVRAYLDRPVPEDVIKQVLMAALMAPSWGNNQPWEIAVVSGPALERIKKGFLKAVDEGQPLASDFTFPASWPEANQKRYFENGERMYLTLGIARDDQKAREEFGRRGCEFFGAPHVIFLFLDEGLSPWALHDLGLFCQTLMLAAHSMGLGTCPMASAIIYPDLVREALGLPSNKKLALGIPIGYPDQESKINQHRSTRISMDEAVRWYHE